MKSIQNFILYVPIRFQLKKYPLDTYAVGKFGERNHRRVISFALSIPFGFIGSSLLSFFIRFLNEDLLNEDAYIYTCIFIIPLLLGMILFRFINSYYANEGIINIYNRQKEISLRMAKLYFIYMITGFWFAIMVASYVLVKSIT